MAKFEADFHYRVTVRVEAEYIDPEVTEIKD
jgi:hypothetical protein